MHLGGLVILEGLLDEMSEICSLPLGRYCTTSSSYWASFLPLTSLFHLTRIHILDGGRVLQGITSSSLFSMFIEQPLVVLYIDPYAYSAGTRK